MSVYAGEDADHFRQCLDGIRRQTVMPDEFVLVKDGALTRELDEVISDFRGAGAGCGLRAVSLPENVTQGPARAEGVKEARYGWVAIMDSDDVCRPDRFEKQLQMIGANPALGLIGGQIAEFVSDPGRTASVRAVPVSHCDIVKFIKRRNPFNQMTVMFRRDLAIEAGNYGYFPGFEDYDLWARMVRRGAVCANHPDVLVDARIGAGMHGRRKGLRYVKYEWRMQERLLQCGLINKFDFCVNVGLRAPVRLLPVKGVEAFYSRYIRRHPRAAGDGRPYG